MAARQKHDAQSTRRVKRNMNLQYMTTTTVTQRLTHASQVGRTRAISESLGANVPTTPRDQLPHTPTTQSRPLKVRPHIQSPIISKSLGLSLKGKVVKLFIPNTVKHTHPDTKTDSHADIGTDTETQLHLSLHNKTSCQARSSSRNPLYFRQLIIQRRMRQMSVSVETG